MNLLNSLLTVLGNWLFWPFSTHPTAGLLFWSAVTGIVMTFVFGKTSNQDALRRAVDRGRAQLLAIKLFKDDLTVTMWCQLALLRATGLRLWHSLPPMLVMIAPLLLVLTQLALRYEYRPLVPGETAVLALRLEPDAWNEYQDVELQTVDGVSVDAGSLRDAASATVYWRIRASGGQTARLGWQLGERRVEKEVSIAGNQRALQPTNRVRPGPGFWERVLYPGEPGLAADSPVASIEVHYQRRATPLFGIDVPWWATFFVVSMAVAFGAGKVIGVQF